ncbi:MAG: tyrosine-protein phosphatase [Crocinitomicaceae bacterium]|jgi:tyrosine-protein phosphatase YwqE|tara:strand:- start:649 stop:1392 length:744 start_codon:yes stop_codon:yes gene_type:complete
MGIFSNLFKKKEVLPPFDLGRFKSDMHSHLIPGIDDGAQDMDQTIAMLAKFESLGYKKVVTTPHIMTDSFPNNPEIILSGLEKVKNEIKKVGIEIEIEAAAEYYFDETLMPKIKNKELLTFGDNYVLVEFAFHSPPQFLDQLFFELKTHGYRPVIAHFERYLYYLGKIDKAEKWRSEGINIQINLNSLFGQYGPEVQKQAEKLIDEGQFDFVGTDCHRIEHLMILEKNLSSPYLHKIGKYLIKNMVL